MSDDFQSHELVTATKLNRALRSGRCVGRARRITNSNATSGTTFQTVLRLDDIPVFSGRQYGLLTTNFFLDGSVANDVAQAFVLYTTDGSTPTIASAQFPGAYTQTVVPNISFGEARPIITSYIPAADETLSLLLCIARGSGTGVITLQANGSGTICEMRLMDCGEDPGDTGVDV